MGTFFSRRALSYYRVTISLALYHPALQLNQADGRSQLIDHAFSLGMCLTFSESSFFTLLMDRFASAFFKWEGDDCAINDGCTEFNWLRQKRPHSGNSSTLFFQPTLTRGFNDAGASEHKRITMQISLSAARDCHAHLSFSERSPVVLIMPIRSRRKKSRYQLNGCT